MPNTKFSWEHRNGKIKVVLLYSLAAGTANGHINPREMSSFLQALPILFQKGASSSNHLLGIERKESAHLQTGHFKRLPQ